MAKENKYPLVVLLGLIIKISVSLIEESKLLSDSCFNKIPSFHNSIISSFLFRINNDLVTGIPVFQIIILWFIDNFIKLVS